MARNSMIHSVNNSLIIKIFLHSFVKYNIRFGGGFGRRDKGENRGPNINLQLDATLEELYIGRSIDVEINKQIVCPVCHGSGARSEEDVNCI